MAQTVNGYRECAKILVKAGDDVTLICAVSNGYRECANILVKAGADINATDRNGQTALTRAALEGPGSSCMEVFRGGYRILRRRGRNPPGMGRQHTNLPDFPKNCMKLRKF